MRLSYDNIYKEKAFWDERNIIVPNYDTKVIKGNTRKNPQWLHFGGGNIFRGYIACLADTLIEEGIMDTGIIATDSFDDEIFEKVYQPYDNLALLVGLRRSGEKYLRVIGSVVGAVSAVGEKQKDLAEIAVKCFFPDLRLKAARSLSRPEQISYVVVQAVTRGDEDLARRYLREVPEGMAG